MNVLEDLIKKRNRTADEIGELLAMSDTENNRGVKRGKNNVNNVQTKEGGNEGG